MLFLKANNIPGDGCGRSWHGSCHDKTSTVIEEDETRPRLDPHTTWYVQLLMITHRYNGGGILKVGGRGNLANRSDFLLNSCGESYSLGGPLCLCPSSTNIMNTSCYLISVVSIRLIAVGFRISFYRGS